MGKYRSLIESLRYLTNTRTYLMLSVRIASRYMEESMYSHRNALKRIRRYVRGIMSLNLLYTKSDDYQLIGYSDNNWCEDVDDWKCTARYIIFHGKDDIYLTFEKITYYKAFNLESQVCCSILECM